MALIGNMNHVYSKITTVWPSWWPAHLSLATKPDGAAVQRCLELLFFFFFPKQYVNWDVKQLNKEWEVGDGQGNTQHVTALQAWRRDDVISVLSLFPSLLNFILAHLLFMGGGGKKKSLQILSEVYLPKQRATAATGCFSQSSPLLHENNIGVI